MKIIIASTVVPFVDGGSTFIVDWLERKLREYGHQVDAIKIPFSSYYKDMLSQMLAMRLYHLEDACDRLIAIRMPAYLIKHPQKYLWFIHHYREIYDLWDTELNTLPKNAETLAIREYIMRADSVAFEESKKIYTNSRVVSNRLLDFNGIIAAPVYPPILNPEQFHCASFGDYIYYASRICHAKRQHLAVEAMKYTKTPVKLMITGKADQNGYLDDLYSLVKCNGLEKKVALINEWITEKQKVDYFAKCLAALYIPFDEDSYGYPSLEAHHSEKAVISCLDSGGTDELIVDGENGLLVKPAARALAQAFDRLYENKSLAEAMGSKGKERIKTLEINWDNVIRKFTE